MTRCPGFDGYCNAPLTNETSCQVVRSRRARLRPGSQNPPPMGRWVVGGTMHRGEWDACERCALDALRYTHSEVWDLVTGERTLTLEEAS